MASRIKLTVERNAVVMGVTRRVIKLSVSEVNGPSSSIKNNLVKFGSTNGKKLEDSGIPVTDVARLSQDNTFAGKHVLQNIVRFNKTITPTQLIANTNNYNPTSLSTALMVRISSSKAINLTGLYVENISTTDGRMLFLSNIGSYTITLKKESTNSTEKNRFSVNADIELSSKQTVMLVYDATLERWKTVGYASGGGGGGYSPDNVTIGLNGSDELIVNDDGIGSDQVQDLAIGLEHLQSDVLSQLGGSVPTGTGFRHITGDAEDGTAKLVENDDVASDAAIVESKLNLNFSTHNNLFDPTEDEKDALSGTAGTPSDTNRYVTNSDSRLLDARTPTTHTHTASDVTDLGTAALEDSTAFDAAGLAAAALISAKSYADDVMSDHIGNYNHLSQSQYSNVLDLKPMAFQSDVVSDDFRYVRKDKIWVRDEETLTFILGDGNAVLEAGQFVHIPIGKSLNVKKWYAGGDGTIQVDLWKKAGAVPTESDAMIGSEGTKIGLASDTINNGTTDDWRTTEILEGDYIIANILSVDGVMTQFPFVLKGDKI